MIKTQKIPPSKELEVDLDEKGAVFLSGDAYEVMSWRPGRAHSGEPCTEVHLLLPLGQVGRVVLRLKSTRALDELVGVLLEYRKQVWP